MAKTAPVDTGRMRDIAELTEAFELFTQKTSLLEKAYGSLKEQFKAVNLELAQTNQTLKQKVIELKELTAHLNGILSNMSQGLMVVDDNGLISTFNPAAEQILDRGSKEVLNRPFAELFDFDLASGGKVSYGSKQLELSISRLPCGRLLLLRDVTELLYLQRMTQRQDRLKELGEMAASVAHEIRNPLGGIEGWASLLKRDLADRPASEQMAERIIDGVRTLNRLVSNILHYSRPVELNLEPCDLASLLTDCCSAFQMDPQCGASIRLVQDYQEGLSTYPLDRILFKSIILNLLLNACQAMPDGGTIRVSLSSDEAAEALVSVRDEGCGIAAENLEKIFSPFFTTKQEGNGFGLSEVHRCIQVLGGEVSVESQLGVGTTFTLSLPQQGSD